MCTYDLIGVGNLDINHVNNIHITFTMGIPYIKYFSVKNKESVMSHI